MKQPVPLFFEPIQDGSLRCGLCPHQCILRPNARGRCGIRGNDAGTAVLDRFGMVSAVADDPIEKKPLYHYRPGSRILSIGFVSCNLRCPFCQNWGISQDRDAQASFLPPAELVRLAADRGFRSIAYTYSEPLIHIEYLIEAMTLARETGIANVLVTNGCVLAEPARLVLPLCDAANVDLKSWNEDTYRNILGGDLETVKGFIAAAAALGVHIEATTLVVTGLNDKTEEVVSCAEFLAGISPDLPYHLSAYRPEYKWREPPTSPELLAECAAEARKRLTNVYVGNVPGESNDTTCRNCGAALVRRRGYGIETVGLRESGTAGYECSGCGKPVPFKR